MLATKIENKTENIKLKTENFFVFRVVISAIPISVGLGSVFVFSLLQRFNQGGRVYAGRRVGGCGGV